MENNNQLTNYYDNKNWQLYSSLIWLGFVLLNLFLILMIGIISTKGNVIFSRNIHSIIRQFALFIIICPTMAILMRYGKLDLSIFSAASLVSMVIALLSINNIPGFIIFILVFFIVFIIGLINSIFTGLLNVNSFIFTFCMAILLQGVVLAISKGRVIPINNISKFQALIIPMGFFILLIMISSYICLYLFTSFGKKTASDLDKKNVNIFKRYLFMGIPFIISSIIAGIYGFLHLSYIGASIISTLSFNKVLDILIVLVLSGVILGKGNVNFIIVLAGTVIGGFLIVILNNFMSISNLPIGFHYIIKAAFFINILFFFLLFHWINKLVYKNYGNKNQFIN